MDMVIVAVVAVLVTATTAFGSGFKKLIDAWFLRREKRLLKAGYIHGLTSMVEFAIILEQMRRVASVDRVLVFVGQNGGGLPSAGKPYTVRCNCGWSNRPGVDVLRNYNFDLLVDRSYCEMLLKMIECGSVLNRTSDMVDGAILKSFYRDEGVFESIMYFLNCDGSQLVYLSVASYSQEFTKDQLVLIEMLVQRLRGVMARSGG